MIKFNNARGAMVCNKCHVIMKSNLTKEEMTDTFHMCPECIEKIGYLCGHCAEKLKWTWPKHHAATMHGGECDVCGEHKTLSCENDWLKVGQTERNWIKHWD
jgi:hypothetical protein